MTVTAEAPRFDIDAVLLGPNWFASVMGIGIVANAMARLPMLRVALHTPAVVIWTVAAAWLLILTSMTATNWIRRRSVIRTFLEDPAMAPFFGAPPMAVMTVGAGALLAGHTLIGNTAAVTADWVLWSLGTAGGLVTIVLIPYLLFTRHEVRPDEAFGGWLMAVVPPMVSAATGALLVSHLGAGPARATLLYGCYALFGMSLITSLIIITMIWMRLALHGIAVPRVPTGWIVLGPIGQSITAVGLLGTAAPLAVTGQLGSGLHTMAVLYGLPAWGFASLWVALAVSITVRTLRRGLPFALTWWSFIFPIGTYVTGTTQLAAHTDLPAFRWWAVIACACLVVACVVVASRTVRGAIKGGLLQAPLTPAHVIVASKDGSLLHRSA